MMKKTLLLMLVLLCLLFPIGASAYTAYVSVDGSLDFSSIQKFQFDASVPVALDDITPYMVDIAPIPPPYNGPFGQGALPVSNVWSIGVLTVPNPGANGFDLSVFGGPGDNLEQGVILSIFKQDPFTLSNFILQEYDAASFLYVDYPFPFTVAERPFTDGVEYIYTAVPIPGSILLLGSGVLGLVGLARRKRS